MRSLTLNCDQRLNNHMEDEHEHKFYAEENDRIKNKRYFCDEMGCHKSYARSNRLKMHKQICH